MLQIFFIFLLKYTFNSVCSFHLSYPFSAIISVSNWKGLIHIKREFAEAVVGFIQNN